MITLKLDIIQADLLRSVLDEKIDEMRYDDAHDPIDFERIREIRNEIDGQLKNYN